MNNLSPEKQKWILLGTLSLAAVFNISVHHFEKDENGFAIIHPRDQDHRPDTRSPEKLALSDTQGLIELGSAGTAENEKPKEAPAKSPAAPQEIPSQVAKNTVLENEAKASENAAKIEKQKAEQEAQRLKSEKTPETTPDMDALLKRIEKLVDDRFAALTLVKPDTSLIEKVIEGQITVKGEVKRYKARFTKIGDGQVEGKISWVNCDSCSPVAVTLQRNNLDNVSELQEFLDKELSTKTLAKSEEEMTPEERKKEKERKEKEKLKLQHAKVFEEIRTDCSDRNKARDVAACKANKLIEVARENRKESDPKRKIPESLFADFFREDIEPILSELLEGRSTDGESTSNIDIQRNIQAGMKINQTLIAKAPKEVEEIRSRAIDLNVGAANMHTFNYQIMERQRMEMEHMMPGFSKTPQGYAMQMQSHMYHRMALSVQGASMQVNQFGLMQAYRGQQIDPMTFGLWNANLNGAYNLMSKATLHPLDPRYNLMFNSVSPIGGLNGSMYSPIGLNAGLMGNPSMLASAAYNPALLSQSMFAMHPAYLSQYAQGTSRETIARDRVRATEAVQASATRAKDAPPGNFETPKLVDGNNNAVTSGNGQAVTTTPGGQPVRRANPGVLGL